MTTNTKLRPNKRIDIGNYIFPLQLGYLEKILEKDKKKEIVVAIEKILEKYGFLSYGEQKVAEDLLERLKKSYFYIEFGERYQEIDKKIYELKRKIRVNDKTEEDVEIPLFFKYSPEEIGEKIYSIKRKWGEEIVIKVLLPYVTEQAKEKIREAYYIFYKTYADALREKPLFELIKDENQRKIFDIEILFIPTAKEIKEIEIVEKDPLVIAKLYDKLFLIYYWKQNEVNEIEYINHLIK